MLWSLRCGGGPGAGSAGSAGSAGAVGVLVAEPGLVLSTKRGRLVVGIGSAARDSATTTLSGAGAGAGAAESG